MAHDFRGEMEKGQSRALSLFGHLLWGKLQVPRHEDFHQLQEKPCGEAMSMASCQGPALARQPWP